MDLRMGGQVFRAVKIPLLWGTRAIVQDRNGALSVINLGGSDAILEILSGEPAEGTEFRPTESGFDVLIPPHSTTIGAVLSAGPPFSAFAGDGAQKHADEIRGAGFALLPAPFGMPTAAGLLRALANSPSGEPVEDVARWQPEYLRSSSAQRCSGSGA